ncbi:hypothetical protein HDU96_001294 [Phlyctochytrium bullatum]|nr:hypothetical protein HDU96_001294 [Phlyctochytrium bullatum]
MGAVTGGALLESTLLTEWVDLGNAPISDTHARLAHTEFHDPLASLNAASPSPTLDAPPPFPKSLAVAASLLSFPPDRATPTSETLLLTTSWLAHFRRDLLTFRFVEAAAAAGRVDVLRLLDGLGVDKFSMAVMDAAAREGRLEAVRFLNEKRGEGCSYAAMRRAGANGHLDVLEYLWRAGKKTSWAVVLAEAAEGGHTSVVEFLFEKATGDDPNAVDARKELFSPDSPPPPFVSVIKSGRVDLLGFIESRFHPLPPPSPSFMGAHYIEVAIVACKKLGGSNVEMLEHLLGRGYRPDRRAGYKFINDGGAKAVAALLKYVGTVDWPEAMDSAAANGDLELVKLLHDHITKRRTAGEAVGIAPTASTMNFAAQNGHLAVVKFLHEHRSEGCSSSGLYWACRHGHFDVVRFLVETRKEVVITKDVMVAASSKGNLEIFKFLYDRLEENPGEVDGVKGSSGGSEKATKFVKASGNCETMRYLHEQHELPLPGAQEALFSGWQANLCELSELQYLHERGIGGWDSPHVSNALIASKNAEMLRYAHAHNLCRFEPQHLKAVIMGGTFGGNMDVLDLLLGELLPPDAVEGIGGFEALIGEVIRQSYPNVELLRYLIGYYAPVETVAVESTLPPRPQIKPEEADFPIALWDFVISEGHFDVLQLMLRKLEARRREKPAAQPIRLKLPGPGHLSVPTHGFDSLDVLALLKEGMDKGLLELDGILVLPSVDAWRYVVQAGWMVPVDDKSILVATKKKDVELLRLLHTLGATASALGQNTLDVTLNILESSHIIIPYFRALQETGFARVSNQVIDIAVMRSDFEVVKFLHYHVAGAGCTTRAMNEAATNGSLDMVKFLHANRHEGCTATAMDYAAENNDLETVKFLHENRTEGCTSAALNNAVRFDNSGELVRLLATRKESDLRAAFVTGARVGKTVGVKVLGEVIEEKEGKEGLRELVRKALTEVGCLTEEDLDLDFFESEVAETAGGVVSYLKRKLQELSRL